MSQANILKLLKKEKEWLTTKEIMNKLKLSGNGNITRELKTLYKCGEIRRKIIIKYYWRIK